MFGLERRAFARDLKKKGLGGGIGLEKLGWDAQTIRKRKPIMTRASEILREAI